jgi:N4-gp56 family major capsid protein
LTEGVTPGNSTFSVEELTCVLDQWGDVITITDVAKLTTKHPLVKIATDLLSDNAQRLIDREIQIVMLAGTNVMYGDGSVSARSAITTSMTVSDTILHQARINLISPSGGTGGAEPRSGPSNMKENASGGPLSGTLMNGGHFVALCGPQICADVQKMASSVGMWREVNVYNDKTKIYNSEVGTYLGYRWVETNFIPEFKVLGNTTVAVASGGSGGITGLTVTAVDGGGTLTSATTYFWKVTRKNLYRGFEETISIAHSTASTATANNESFTFALPSTAGYVYNVYFDKTQAGGTAADSNLGLVSENAAAGTTVTVTGVATSSTTPPTSLNTTGPVTGVYPLYLIGSSWLGWVGLQNLKTYTTGGTASASDPLAQRSTIGFKFMSKAVILNQLFGLRVELASAFS